jgi:hypothetical protein
MSLSVCPAQITPLWSSGGGLCQIFSAFSSFQGLSHITLLLLCLLNTISTFLLFIRSLSIKFIYVKKVVSTFSVNRRSMLVNFPSVLRHVKFVLVLVPFISQITD